MGTDAVTIGDVALRLVAAMVCGALLGWERESQHKSAGFRTNMLIALGSAAFTVMSMRVAHATGFSSESRIDPLRAIQGIIGGIGFLGAGAIIRSGGSVHGMTTAATIWVVCALGVCCGVGAFDIALLCALLAFVVLAVFGVVERRLIRRPGIHNHIEPTDSGEGE